MIVLNLIIHYLAFICLKWNLKSNIFNLSPSRMTSRNQKREATIVESEEDNSLLKSEVLPVQSIELDESDVRSARPSTETVHASKRSEREELN